jgi:hypothetical protein
MIQANINNASNANAPRSPVSWGSIFAGGFVAVALEIVLAMLGLAVGLWFITPRSLVGSAVGIGIGEGIWWIVTSMISLFLGGWVTGRLCGYTQVNTFVHGIVVWGLVSVFVIYSAVVGLGTIIGGTFSVIQNSLGGIMQAAQSTGLTQQLGNQIQQEIQSLTHPNGQQLTAQEQQQILQRVQTLLAPNGDTPANRQQLADLLVQYAGMSPQDALNTVDQWVNNYQSTLRAAAQGTATAAKAIGGVAIWVFFMLVLSGGSSIMGAIIGTNYKRE